MHTWTGLSLNVLVWLNSQSFCFPDLMHGFFKLFPNSSDTDGWRLKCQYLTSWAWTSQALTTLLSKCICSFLYLSQPLKKLFWYHFLINPSLWKVSSLLLIALLLCNINYHPMDELEHHCVYLFNQLLIYIWNGWYLNCECYELKMKLYGLITSCYILRTSLRTVSVLSFRTVFYIRRVRVLYI